MDPSYVDSDEEADAMAKAMGFSSFGTQGLPKKRKFNPSADAVVDGQKLSLLDKGGKKGQGSGGNIVPLGKPRVLGIASASNGDEIALDDEDGEDEEVAYIDTSMPPPREQGAGNVDEGPTHVDTSLPPPDADARAAQQRIDAILAGNPGPPIPLNSKGTDNVQVSERSRGIGQFMTALHEAPQPLTPDVASSVMTGASVMGRWRPRDQGQKNELWYVEYYDPSFNENPWARLEKAKGLQARGTWIDKGGQAVSESHV